ncbi:MAG: hypothetical protein R3C11_04920 [Planctomycetaceae bacterium]
MHNIKSRLQNDEMVVAIGVGRVPHYNLIQMVGINQGFHAVWLTMNTPECRLRTWK